MGRMIQSTPLLLCIFFFGLPLLSIRTASAQEFNYNEGSGSGPSHWGKFSPTCSNGHRQSPIDLGVNVVSNLGDLRKNYKASNAILKNQGHQIMLSWEGGGGAGSINIDGTEYILQQTHWHSPSEHAINGKRYDLEQHLLHRSSNGEQAVVGILYQYGNSDAFLSSITNHLRALGKKSGAERAIGSVNPNGITFGGRNYYRYIGSLTTPPCTENVKWTILQAVGTVSRDQVKLLQDSLNADAKSNARPLQALNNRNVQLYKPE